MVVVALLVLAAAGLAVSVFVFGRRLWGIEALVREMARSQDPFLLPRREATAVDNIKDAGVVMPADQDDLEAWAHEMELAGTPVNPDILQMQRKMRYAEGL